MAAKEILALLVILLLACCGCCDQPRRLPQVKIEKGVSGACPSAEAMNQARNKQKGVINSILSNFTLLGGCPCGGAGSWRRFALLNMSDPNQQCPQNWRLITSPERACGRSSTAGSSCDSAIFSSSSQTYSRLCGRIVAYQRGTSNAFEPSIQPGDQGIDDVYLDGISITHGAAGSRQHIWSFVAAAYDVLPELIYGPRYVCPCTNSSLNWPYQVPSFIGDNYFCDTGNTGPGHSLTKVYTEDPLWDGAGCSHASTCCQFNAPPWFCTALPQPTTDDIELRICGDSAVSNEDLDITLVDIYAM